jgi:hypothetical protein
MGISRYETIYPQQNSSTAVYWKNSAREVCMCVCVCVESSRKVSNEKSRDSSVGIVTRLRAGRSGY